MSEIVTVNVHTDEDTAIGLSKLDQADIHILAIGPVRVFLARETLMVLGHQVNSYLMGRPPSNLNVTDARGADEEGMWEQKMRDEASGAYDYLEVG